MEIIPGFEEVDLSEVDFYPFFYKFSSEMSTGLNHLDTWITDSISGILIQIAFLLIL